MCVVGPMTQFASLNNLHPEGLEMFHAVNRPCSGLYTGGGNKAGGWAVMAYDAHCQLCSRRLPMFSDPPSAMRADIIHRK